jgi:hypothetical protein
MFRNRSVEVQSPEDAEEQPGDDDRHEDTRKQRPGTDRRNPE